MRDQLQAAPSAPVTLQRDVRLRPRLLPRRSTRLEFPRASPCSGCSSAATRRGRLGAHLFGNVGEIDARGAEGPALQGPSAGRPDRPGWGRVRVRPLPARARGRDPGPGRLAGPPEGPAQRVRRSPATTCSSASTPACRRPARRPVGARAPGRFVAMDIRQRRRCSAWARSRPSTPRSSPSRSRQAQYERLTSDDTGAPLTNRAIRGAYPTGSTFKPITAMAALNGGT